MGSKRTKEDDVLKISTSVFVTNFPEQVSAKDLWNAFHRPKCSTSSHQPAMKEKIKDSSIGNTKDNGHRDDVSSYANVVKNQSQGNGENDSKPVLVLDDSCVNTQDYSCCLNGKVKEVGVLENLKVALGNEGFTDIDLRYMGGLWVMIAFDSVEAKEKFLLSTGVCSWFSQLIQASSEFITDERVTMVEIEGIPLKVWNENTFIRIASKWGTLLNVENLEKENYHCKRLCVLTKSMSHIFESFKINYKGKTHWVRAIEIPGWTPDLDDQNDEESDSEDEECEEVFKKDFGESDEEVQGENDVSRVSDTEVEEENPKSKDGVVSSEQNGKQSEDPFNIYSLLNKDKMKNNKEASTKESLEYPPGFTPRENDVENVEMDNQKDNCDGEFGNVNNISDEVNFSSGFNTYKKAGGESMDSDHCRESEGSRKGGSILMLMDELVKVGQTMGYNMDGCMKNIEEIIESQGVDGVNFLTLQETKMESIDLFEIKRCWGNFAFDYVHSASVGKSGGILCVWDPNAFKKLNSTASDYFVMIQGNWVSNGKLLLIISVYAPQELSEKKSLWDYLCHVIDNWKGSVIIMGDFNEVRNKNERFGTIFNVHGANAFNSFISMTNLEEVPLGGCSFTWCHISTSKMSKLDRFLMSESLLIEISKKEDTCLEWHETKSKNSKTVLKQELADLEMIIDKGDASSDTLHKRAEVVKSIQEVDKLCAMEASQKAKIKWAIEGGENSKYYHGILNKKRNQLSIRGVLVEGDWVENPNMVKNEFLNHFKNRFDRPKSVRPMLNMEFPHHLNSMQQLDLEAEVSNEEIKKAVWDCGVDKSPGPDGFTFGFYKRFWSLIEKDVLAAVKYFFHYSRIPKGCNSSFIALIPKTPEAKMVKDFRPISLIGSLYKIIAKILANRLVVVLGDIVNEVQSAFVADRQILDGPFILNEVLQWCKLKKKHSFILKIDFEKAYDSVRWDYLDDVLRKFGFGEKWCGWIQECLRSSWGSVLVNGSPTEEFQFFKGLKQGDPLSPFIFILVMESLHISFKRVVDAGMFNGIVLNSVMHLSHMFYADDAVFMGQWSTKNIDTIIYVLKCFHRASGLSINLSKSKLLGVVVSEDRVVQAANRIGCGVLKAPFAYLGSKVGGNMSRIKSWDEIVDKMVDRLSKWKMKTLSIGGRLTLLKAVLGSMPIYHMSIFKVPMKVLQRMESIRSRFFSGVDLNSKKSIWVKWSKVLCSKEKGGLGVSSLYALNRALMCKWVWRFTTQKNLLWTRVIKAIHGEDGKNGSGFKVGYKSIWRSILQEVETLKIKGIHLNNFMQKKLGNGADTYFWEDLWHGDMVLKQRYPRLYALEVKKTVDVASKLSQENLTWSFRRAPRSGVEQDQLTDLTTYVEGVVLGVTPDRWYWTLDGSGEFSVASARKVIDDNRFPEVSTQTRWIKAVPIKVNIHAWKVRMDCLPTRLNIFRLFFVPFVVASRNRQVIYFLIALLRKIIFARFAVGGRWIS
ncbi:RNA-directed DNA polymerase, eukaryota [Tanacetum coccineum]